MGSTRWLGLLVLPGLLACDDIVEPVDALEVRVIARSEWVEVGESVELIGVAHNPTERTIEAGRGCSPGIGLLVTSPEGETVDLAAGPHICPLRDNNEIRPGETDFQAYDWTQGAAGVFEIRAAVLTDRGPRALSAAVAVTAP